MTTTDNSPLLDLVSAKVRRSLVAERVRAMRGGLPEAIRRLGSLAVATGPDGAAAGLLAAELLDLDRQQEQATTTFDTLVTPHRKTLSLDAQFAVDADRATLELHSTTAKSTDGFYHLIDRQRAVGFDRTDPLETVHALEAQRDGKPADALPALWRQLDRAYRRADWQATRWAARRYGLLCQSLGFLDDAWQHLMTALDDKAVEPLAQALAQRRDPAIVRAVVDRCLKYAHLKRHFVVAAKLVAEAADIIPDDQLPAVVAWLLPRCRENYLNGYGDWPMPVAWEALAAVGERLPPELAAECVGVALTHPVWSAPLPGPGRALVERKVFVEAVTTLAVQLPTARLGPLADAILPLATARIESHDYVHVINLLCYLAERCGSELKQRLRSPLFPPGQPRTRVLAQVAQLFGADEPPPQDLDRFAGVIAGELRLSVQRVKPGEAPQPMPEASMTLNQTLPDSALVVNFHGTMGLGVLSRSRHKLSYESLVCLMDVLIRLNTDRDNLLGNRRSLLGSLIDFADRLPDVLRGRVVEAIEPLARGPVPESLLYPTAAEADNPQSAARWQMGRPEDVQSVAVVAYAAVATPAAALAARAIGVVTEAMADPSAVVRRGAYAAAGRFPVLTPEQLLSLIFGLRDPDPSAGRAAFAAFIRRPEWKLSRPNWKLFLLAAQMAGQSPDAGLRRHAAEAVSSRRRTAPTAALAEAADALLRMFAGDINIHVRRAAGHD